MAPQFLRVVVNRGDRYALWPYPRPTPPGWSDTHFIGSRIRCLAQIGETTRGRRPVRPEHPGATVTGLLAEVIARTPDAAAVVHLGRPTSFLDLDHRSGALAGVLAEHGVRPGDTVGLRLRGGVDAVVGRLAVLKAGAAYLPVPAGQPVGAPATGLATGLRLMLTEPEWSATARREAPRVLAWRHRALPGRRLLRPVRADDGAYVSAGPDPLGGLLLAHRHLVLAASAPMTSVPGPALAGARELVAPGVVEGALWGSLLRGGKVELDLPDVRRRPRPVPAVRWHVLDEALFPARVGRLHLTAAWLGSRFADHPVRAAQWLVPDPSDPTGENMMLRTGRWAERAPDGTVRLLDGAPPVGDG